MSSRRSILQAGALLALGAVVTGARPPKKPHPVKPTPTPEPAPTPTPVPEPTPYPTDDLTAAIAATPTGGVLDCGGATFAAPAGGFVLDRAITLNGAILTSGSTTGNASTGTLRVTADGATVGLNVVVRGGFVGIVLDRVSEVAVRASVVGVVYAGILTLSATDCTIDGAAVTGVRPLSDANGWNAYGITLTNLAGQPLSKRILVRDCEVSDVPTWHGLDTHGGEDISFIDNETHGCRRGIFLTDSPARVVCVGNTLYAPTADEQAQTPPGGAPSSWLTDIRGISVVGGSGEIRDNTGTGYPATRWWNPIVPGDYVFSGNSPEIA